MSLPPNAQAPERVEAPDASCAIYRDAPSKNAERTVAIGQFRCASAQTGAAMLRLIAGRLRTEGFAALLGPMDGDTWHSYRVIAETDGSRPFFLEPVSGLFDHQAFREAGFAPVSSYVSARSTLDAAIGAPAPAVPGIAVTAWDGRDAMSLIGGLFELSRHAFAGNAYYKPITREAFLQLYQPILPAIDPRLVFFARHADGRLAGYLFAIPDRLQGAQPTTGIIKTYASAVPGVGRMLVDSAHRTLASLGYIDVVHALMHVDNRSRKRSALHEANVFRRYDLMGLSLAAAAT
jgi:hypothetical protein